MIRLIWKKRAKRSASKRKSKPSLRAALLALPAAWALVFGACAISPTPEGPLPAAAHPTAPGRALFLPADDRAALLRVTAAALERSPDPLPVVHTEGTLPALPAYKRALQARRDWAAMAVLASAYAMERKPGFLQGYARYLFAWLGVYQISGNPIDETRLGDWLLAYRSAGGALPAELSERMRRFACDLAARHGQAQPPARQSSTNNWQSHRAKLAVMGALTCGTPALVASAERVFARQIRDNLLPNGASIDFAQRDALHYVVYSIEPLLEAALFSRLYGRSLYEVTGPDGQSIARTLNWLSPYARGDKVHQEFVHSGVRFDAERAAAGVPGFSGPFSPQQARLSYWLAARLDPRWSELSEKLGSPPIAQRAPWLVQ